MRALRLRDGRPRVCDHPDPVPTQGEALVRITCAGICGTDLEIARGYLGFDGIPGHEFVGVVESGPDANLIGRRVVGEINASCGTCALCRSGLPRHCPDRTVLGILGRDGAFAERTCLPVRNLHPIPDGLPDRVAVFAEPMAAAWEIVEQGLVPASGRVLILGDGRLGQLCARVIRGRVDRVEVLGRHRHKLDLLARRGITVHDRMEAVSGRFDLVVEATGRSTGLAIAAALVRPTGTIALKTTTHDRVPVDLSRIVIDEIRVVGSRCGPFEPALHQLESDPDMVEDLVTATFDLENATRAFERASSSDALKVLLRP